MRFGYLDKEYVGRTVFSVLFVRGHRLYTHCCVVINVLCPSRHNCSVKQAAAPLWFARKSSVQWLLLFFFFCSVGVYTAEKRGLPQRSVSAWISKFKVLRTNVSHEGAERPSVSMTDDNIDWALEQTLSDRRVTVYNLTHHFPICQRSACVIMRDLGLEKFVRDNWWSVCPYYFLAYVQRCLWELSCHVPPCLVYISFSNTIVERVNYNLKK